MHPLESESPLIVYLDFKSPYAYLAKGPSRQLEHDFGIAIDCANDARGKPDESRAVPAAVAPAASRNLRRVTEFTVPLFAMSFALPCGWPPQ